MPGKFPRGGVGCPPGNFPKLSAFIFMRRVRTLEGSVFEDFSKVGLGGPPWNFSKSGHSFLCAGCVL